MKSLKNKIVVVLALVLVVALIGAQPALAADNVAQVGNQGSVVGDKALSSAIAIGLSAGAAAIAMGIAIAKAAEGISRQPEAEGSIRTTLMLGLVFIETVVIYALIVAILVIFVL